MSRRAEQHFLAAAQTKKVLNAYLITCSQIDVAARLADKFLLHLFCKNNACGKCSDCQKVKSGHIDILRLCAPKVDEIRQARSFVAEKAYESSNKVILIDNADNMTTQAVNSLLKELEEPPSGVVFVLTAHSTCKMPPTIVSRCAVIPISADSTPDTISKLLNCDIKTATILAYLSGGYSDEAIRIYNDKKLLALRDQTLLLFHQLLMQKSMAVNYFADHLETNKENINFLLCVMLSYLRDIRVYNKLSEQNIIINCDKFFDIEQASLIFTSRAIRNMINTILETGLRLTYAVHFRLTVERMLFCILEDKHRCTK